VERIVTFLEWFECKILRRHPGFYLATSNLTIIRKVKTGSRARSGNVLICVRCGGIA
jgi:hypothetical protein